MTRNEFIAIVANNTTTMQHQKAIIDAADKYSRSQNSGKPLVSGSLPCPDELWDKYSAYVDDNIDAVQLIVGRSVLTKPFYDKLIKEMQQGGNDR